jgi:ADP-ribose pyrophosphatase YjhB (NUDIX family)
MMAHDHALPAFPPRVVVCVGAVVLKEAKALFVRQAYGGMNGVWSIPWGFFEGRRPHAVIEGPEAAALREVKEESGIEAEIVGLLGIQDDDREGVEGTVYLIFLCRHASGEPRPDGRETDRAAFLSLDEVHELSEPVDEFCRWMVERVLSHRHKVIEPCAENPYSPHLAFL